MRKRRIFCPELHRGLLLLFLIWTFFGFGCRRATDPDSRFREGGKIALIQFEGNKALSNEQLRKYLPVQRKDSYLEENEAAVFDILLQAYAAHGYYHAEIVNVDVIPTRRGWVRLNVRVSEGQPTVVRTFNIKWQSPDSATQKVVDDLPLKRGDIADVAQLNQTVATIKKRLADDGYALATVTESMVVTRDDFAADVVIEIDAGAVCTIDRIRISGLAHAPPDLVYREVEEFEGEVFTPQIEKQIENNLEQLNAFRIITVTPLAGAQDRNDIDLDITVVEGNFQNLKMGIGGQFETNKFLAWTSAVYQHNNFLHRLNQFQLRSRVGWALLPQLWNVEDMGPVTLIEPSVTRRGFLERRLTWNLAIAFQTDVEEKYKLLSPSARFSVSRPFLQRLNVRLSYNIEYIKLFGAKDWVMSVMQQLQDEYEDMRSPIRLADVGVDTVLWLTDKRDYPDNGVVLSFDYRHSGPYLASEVAYNKFRPAVSAYWRPLPFFQIALHAEMGLIYPIGENDYTGIRSNFFLGGHNTVRGWGGKRLAPSVCVPRYPDEQTDDENGDCEKIWIGGKTMVQGNTELRFRVSQIISTIVFLDVGDVQYEVQTIHPNLWNYSVGTGLRIHTPIGRIRLDVGYRLNVTRDYRDEPRVGVHLGLGEAF